MSRNCSFIIVTILLLPLATFGQKNKYVPGFMGKKNVIDFSGVVHPHTTFNILNSGGFNENLRPTKDWWDFGFRAGIGRNVKENLMIGFLFTYLKQSSFGPDNMYDNDLGYNLSIRHEMIDYASKGFALRVEFKKHDGLLPIGFSHSFTAGMTQNSIIIRDYTYSKSNMSATPEKGKVSLPKNIPNEFTLAYMANIRQPISQNICINYGLAYNLNFMPGSGILDVFDGNYNEVISNLSRNRRLSIMTAHVGMSFVF